MRINPFVYGIIVLVVFFGIILGFQAAGIWSISGKVTGSGEQVQPSAADVNSIKGWMTLEQIATTFNVPLAELLKQFDLPADTPAATAIKDLESDTFDVTALRTWLQSRTAVEETAPTQAATPLATTQPLITATPSATEHVAPEKTITGKTTFQELLDWGVPQDAIQKIIGSDLPAATTIIKDYVNGQGMEFSTIKSQLQTVVDQTK